MAEILDEVRAGRFADELRQEEESGYARLEDVRASARETLVEEAYNRLRKTED
jgi:ketol-acid reductoisomerase